MNLPLISVTVCTYNGERYLEKTLDSVLAQDYPNFEVLVVDDGSRDNTIRIIERYASEHDCIRPFFRSNHGLPGSRSFAFAQAKGEWIAIIDHDDLCYPTRLSRQLETARKHPTAGFVFCNTHFIDERDKIIGDNLSRFSLPQAFIQKGEAGNLLLRLGCFVDSESCFIKRETVERLGALDKSLPFTCDYEYFIRAGFDVDFAYSNEILAAWRIHATQATRTFRKIRYEERAIFRRYLRGKDVTAGTNAVLLKRLCRSFAGEILDRMSLTKPPI